MGSMFKVNSKDTRTTLLAPFWCLYCQLWTLLTPCSSVSIVNFEHVIADWVVEKAWQRGVCSYSSLPEYSKKSYKSILGTLRKSLPWSLALVNNQMLALRFIEKRLYSRRFAWNKLNFIQELFLSTSPRNMSRTQIDG